MKRSINLFLCCNLLSSYVVAQEVPIHFTLLHTNDHHGHFWTNTDGEYGMAARQTLFKRIRKEVTESGGFVLTLSGGDINTGTIESDMWLAKPDFYGMNMLGYDAMALGNHEFDHTLDLTLQQQTWANFPFLSANIYSKATGKRIFQPYHIFERAGLKVAVVGLTTQDSQYVASRQVTHLVDFRHPIEDAQTVIDELRSQDKADVVIGLTHMGHYPNRTFETAHTQFQVGDIRLAQGLPTGAMDVIIGGHSQTKVCMKAEQHHALIQVNSNCLPDKVNGTWIMQAQDWGKYIGRADFVYTQGQLKLTRYQLIDVNLKDSIQPRIQPDSEVKALLTPYYEAAQAVSQNVVAYLDRDLPGQRSLVRRQQTALGALVGDAVNNVLGVDFTITNSGTIRDSLAAGVMTNKDLLRVFPFKNKMIKIKTTGAELMHYLARVAQIPAGTGAFPQFYGIILPYQQPLRPEEILIQGQPLDVNRIYSFGVSDFMAYGGDGYPPVIEDAAYEVDEMDLYHRHVLERFFEAQSDLVLLPYFEYAKQQALMARTSLE